MQKYMFSDTKLQYSSLVLYNGFVLQKPARMEPVILRAGHGILHSTQTDLLRNVLVWIQALCCLQP